MENNKIPKIIHYAWFGRGKMNRLAVKCMKSWKRFLPDYEMMEWNEDNFPLEQYPYAQEAYAAKKYAYVADVVRLHALYQYGGIYMDTDVEVCKNLDEFLRYRGFSSFESQNGISTGLMAAEKQSPWIADQLEYYDNRHFNLDDVNVRKFTNVEIITGISLKKHGLQLNNQTQELKYGMMIFPMDYFCAKEADTGIVRRTKNTRSIHHFAGSWVPAKSRFHKRVFHIMVSIMGHERAATLLAFLKRRFKGLKG